MSDKLVRPPLFQIVKQLARRWRQAHDSQAPAVPLGPSRPPSELDPVLRKRAIAYAVARIKQSTTTPIRTLCSLISKSTSIPKNDVEWMAWYSDTPVMITPTKRPAAPFIPPDSKIGGLLDEYVTGDALQRLQMIHDEITKCDRDGRTEEILAELAEGHPEVLDVVCAGKQADAETDPAGLERNGVAPAASKQRPGDENAPQNESAKHPSAEILNEGLSSGSDRPTTRPQRPGKQTAPPKRSWIQKDLDSAIREYKARRADVYNDLCHAVAKGASGATKSARRLFGRNVIVRALGVKSAAMVTKSVAWQEIADDLKLRQRHIRRLPAATRRIGLEIALEQQTDIAPKPVLDQVVRRETIAMLEQALPAKEAQETADKLRMGAITDDEARELVAVVADQKADDQSRRLRQEM
jgi:hypothetical protein